MRAKNTSSDSPTKSPGRVIGRKNSTASTPRIGPGTRASTYAAMVPRTRVTTAVATPTIVEFHKASRNSDEEKTCRYQRSEKPVKGNESDGVSWKLKSTTTASGAKRNKSAAAVTS